MQGEYNQDFRRFGQAFAVGDRESVRRLAMTNKTDFPRRYRNRNRCAEGYRHYVADDLTPEPTARLGPGHDGGLYNVGNGLGRQ